jgi:hypothetical protein
MTRTQIQIPDALYGRTKRFAESREISMAEVCRNALELFISIHAAEEFSPAAPRWTPPVCRSTGMRADPFAHEDWRERIYAERNA